MPGHLHAGLLDFEHPALHGILGQLGRTHGIGVATFLALFVKGAVWAGASWLALRGFVAL